MKVPSRLRIKVGAVELEFEGPEEFLKDNLPELLSAVHKVVEMAPSFVPPAKDLPPEVPGQPVQATTANIAARMGSKTGSDLVLAAAAHLTVSKGIATMTRKAILDEMKNATPYYKKSYSDNLSSYLTTLVKDGKLNETSTDHYTLTPQTKAELAEKIGNP